jgi:outer membrane protein OmpA-like peptidoglycan-associated protein
MKNSTQLKKEIIQVMLSTALLFGASSCNNKQNEENADDSQINSEYKLENISSDNQVQFKIRTAEIKKKKNTVNKVVIKNTISKTDSEKTKNNEESKTAVIKQVEKEKTLVLNKADFVDTNYIESGIIKPNMVAEKLVGGVNSDFAEMGPIVSSNGKTIYFSRYKHPGNFSGKNDEEDIWFADWDETNNKWGEAKNMGAPLNNKYPNFINSISPDGNTLLIGNNYFTNGKAGPGVSLSVRTSTGWSFPKQIVIEGSKHQPALSGGQLSKNKKTLLLAYEQKRHTNGGQDIYVSFVRSDNAWTRPINLGSVVNTSGTETAPFLADDDSTLYFTSNGLPGFGGNDIFVTRRLDSTWQNWSKPKNLGSVVNTNCDQSFFSVSNGNVYFSSENESNGDFDVLTLKTNVTPEEKAPLLAFNSPKIEPVAETASVDSSYFSPFEINTNASKSIVFFEFNKWELSVSSKNELDKIANFLIDQPSIQIELAGFTDNVGALDYNYILSQKRVEAVLAYLMIEFDIDEDRMFVKNYGEAKPMANNETIEGRQLNRRVEMSVKTKLLVSN